MKFDTIKYYLNEAFVNLYRNRLMSLASIITVACCILILCVSFMVMDNIDAFVKGLDQSLSISVYLTDNIPEYSTASLENEISSLPHVESVDYISSDQAFNDFSQSLGEESNILDGLQGKHVLPASLTVNIDSGKNQTIVVNSINSLGEDYNIDQIVYDAGVANMLNTANYGMRIISLFIILSLVFLSVVIIMNTIKLTVTNRRNEILIMKYVGATERFIRLPFVVEGSIIGFLGSVIPAVLCIICYHIITKYLMDNSQFVANIINFVPASNFAFILLPAVIILGIAIGVIGSISSMRRYLKV